MLSPEHGARTCVKGPHSGFTLSMLMTRFTNSSFWQKILTLMSMLMSTVSMVYQNLPMYLSTNNHVHSNIFILVKAAVSNCSIQGKFLRKMNRLGGFGWKAGSVVCYCLSRYRVWKNSQFSSRAEIDTRVSIILNSSRILNSLTRACSCSM